VGLTQLAVASSTLAQSHAVKITLKFAIYMRFSAAAEALVIMLIK